MSSPVGNGGPLRTRLPRQLGYKSVKFITHLTVTDSMKKFGKGPGLQKQATHGTPASERLAVGESGISVRNPRSTKNSENVRMRSSLLSKFGHHRRASRQKQWLI
jgi:DMSO/TMAO reductase YedYZ molybdopterin-dependent catalytic subunit